MGFGRPAQGEANRAARSDYDRRSLSRNPLDDPGKDPAIIIATHSEDVHRIGTGEQREARAAGELSLGTYEVILAAVLIALMLPPCR